MISRKTTTLIANIYISEFSDRSIYGDSLVLLLDDLYDYFYDRGYENWFLDEIQSFSSANPDNLKYLIQNLQDKVSFNHSLSDCEKIGQKILKRLATDIINYFLQSQDKCEFTEQGVKQLMLQLQLDGYIYKNGKLLPVENSVINEQDEQTYLEYLIDSLSFSNSIVIKNHLKSSEEHYANGKWWDCIGNSRAVLEEILKQIAESIKAKNYSSTSISYDFSRAVEVRKFLEGENFFDQKEIEVLSKVYGLLSTTGSHPNISDQNQARLMRNLALALGQYALLSYEGFLGNRQ